jgi:hypothetical protein
MLAREAVADQVRTFVAALALNTAYRINVEELKATRSSPQNRYLNGVAYKLLGDAFGYERDEISEAMCGHYWGWSERKVPKTPHNLDGIKSMPIRTTTTDEHGVRKVLSKMEFADYVAFVQRFAANHGVHIPDPNDGDL